ncbi:MAG: hypothetical protein E7D27_03400 [Clostridium celatum]|nr:hypothetical protein [Clostridium celatum]
MIENIIAYHHTSIEKGKSILNNGFDRSKFKKIHLGYGVQCVLKEMREPLFGGDLKGQVKVEFKNCRFLDYENSIDRKVIKESVDRIIEAQPYEKQLEVAKHEANELIKKGIDAYTYRYGQK